MENTKLIKLLRTFSKDELRNFESFIRSPFFNNGRYLVKFFEEIKKFEPKFSSRHFTKERIYAKLQPSVKYNDAYMRKLISNLTKLADEFLIYNSFAIRNNEKELALLEQYRKRGLDSEFEKLLGNTERKVIGESKKESDFNLYRLYGNAVNYHLDRDYKKVLEYYQKEADSFLKYSVSKFLEMYGDMINSQHMYQANFKMPLLLEILKAAEENDFFGDYSLKVTANTLLIDLKQEHEYYVKLKDALKQAPATLNSDTELNAYLALINFGIRKAHNGETKYYTEIGNFYDIMLEKGVLNEGGYLPYYYFINIVTNRTRMKKYDMAEEFINNYSARLHPDDRGDIVNFCYAKLNFYRKAFEKALEYIAKINLQQTHIKLEVKNYLLMIYYELDMTEEAYYIIDSYKHYIKRDETASDFVMNTNRNFLDSYSGLLKLKVSHKSDEIELLLKKIGSTETLNKQWLIDKGKELIKKGA
jgi:hypothetical protein